MASDEACLDAGRTQPYSPGKMIPVDSLFPSMNSLFSRSYGEAPTDGPADVVGCERPTSDNTDPASGTTADYRERRRRCKSHRHVRGADE
jgi:hypothetical protein